LRAALSTAPSRPALPGRRGRRALARRSAGRRAVHRVDASGIGSRERGTEEHQGSAGRRPCVTSMCSSTVR
jgi:hypothetical protein